MPELPEVETVRRTLLKQLKDLYITDVIINYEKMILDDITYFKNSIKNKRITNILRIGKFLIFEIEDIYLLSHLKMEGKYFYVLDNYNKSNHDHVIFKLSNGYNLVYNDKRKFGSMQLKDELSLYETKPLSNLGNEPFNTNYIDLYNIVSKRNIPIKKALLDQSIMSGLGNIYVDEVLFECRISPYRLTNSIRLEECKDIINNSINILNEAIKHKGTTIRSYTSSLNVFGEYQNYLKVHTKSICPICNNKIEKVEIGGRGTYYCKFCQK